MKILRNLLILLLVALVAIVAVAWFSLNTLVKKGVEKAGPMALKAETKLGGAEILPFTGSGVLKDLFVGNPEGFKTPHALKVHAIRVKLDLASLKTPVVVIPSVQIESPDIYIEGGLTEKNNLRALQKNVEAFAAGMSGPKTAQPAEKQPAHKADTGKKETGQKVMVKDLIITGAKVRWVSPLTLGQEILLPLPDIHLQNLGSDKGGISWGDLSSQVVNALLKASSTVSTQNAGKALEQLKGEGLDKIHNAAGTLKGLFKK